MQLNSLADFRANYRCIPMSTLSALDLADTQLHPRFPDTELKELYRVLGGMEAPSASTTLKLFRCMKW